jgi:hypothetical protein
MAESGAWMPGRQGLMVVVVTIPQVTVIQRLHYPCQAAIKPAKPLLKGVQAIYCMGGKNDFPANMIMFYTG